MHEKANISNAAQILKLIAGLIIVLGIIVGLALADEYGGPIELFVSFAIAAFLSGITLAFAEVIKLLQKLVDKE